MSDESKFMIVLTICVTLGTLVLVSICIRANHQERLEAFKAGMEQKVDPATREVIWVKAGCQ